MVALRLSKFDRIPHVRLSNSIKVIRKELLPGEKASEFFHLNATNEGTAPVRVMKVFWSIGYPWPFKKTRIIRLVDKDTLNVGLPAEMTHGNEVSILEPMQDFQIFIEDIARWIAKKPFRELLIRSLRCGIWPSVGGPIAQRADLRIREMLGVEVRKAKASLADKKTK